MKHKLVRVTWLDSASQSGWHSLRRATAMRPAVIESVGYLIKDTEDYLILASTIDIKGKAHTPYNDISIIPKKSFVKNEILKTAKSKEEKE